MQVFETFVGTRAGVLRIGAELEPLGLGDHRISAIHAFRNREGNVVILAGSYGEGLFRTVDLGRTWSRDLEGMTAPAARTIVPSPLAAGELLCGTEPARLFSSADDGLTWSEFEGIRAIPAHSEWYLPYSPRAGALRNLYARPGSEDHLLAAVEVGGLLQSTDRGLSWSIGPVGPNHDIHQISGSPREPDLLWSSLGYASFGSQPGADGAPHLGGVARSLDGGLTWDVLHTSYTRSTIVPPARPDVVLAGPAPDVGRDGRIEVSIDRGESWEPAGDGIDVPMPDMVELFVPAPDGSVYAICSGGRLLRSATDRWRWMSVLPPGAAVSVQSISFLETSG